MSTSGARCATTRVTVPISSQSGPRQRTSPTQSARRTSGGTGGGYPDGLSGYDIPLASRISFVCDSFDAMVSNRPYCVAMTLGAAVDEAEHEAGRQFCPTASRALVEVVGPPWRMLGRPRGWGSGLRCGVG
ncbi:MAG: HD-GYP domain-containing protein [Solirubrobacteraceae bacterium]